MVKDLLVVGHSHVADLRGLGVKEFQVGGETVRVRYVFKRGGTYDSYLDDEGLYSRVTSSRADIIVVILIGNLIKDSVSNEQITRKARDFYGKIRADFPGTTIVATQPEQRFYKVGNRFGCPVGRDYEVRRRQLNNFLRRSLKSKDHILMISGPGRLDNQDLYRDEVHLKPVGISMLFGYIRKLVRYILVGREEE